MPFAKNFAAMLALPFAGDTVSGFVVESIDVRDTSVDSGGLHRYSVRMVLQGPGGQQALRRALQPLLGAQPVTFSAYGNPYQLWCDRPEIEPLGDRRYAVTTCGAGARLALEGELVRFLAHLQACGRLNAPAEGEAPEAIAGEYMKRYAEETYRQVTRYRSRLSRLEGRAKQKAG